MALDKAKLKDEILKLIDPESPDFNAGDPAQAWADAYDVYAADAEDVSGDAVSVVNAPGMASAIDFSIGTAAGAAGSFGAGFAAYWTGAVFAVGTLPTPAAACPSIGGTTLWSAEITSLVIAVVPAGLITEITSVFQDLSTDIDAKAGALADAFDNATKTGVTVLITGLDTTPPPPLPITNTCTVF